MRDMRGGRVLFHPVPAQRQRGRERREEGGGQVARDGWRCSLLVLVSLGVWLACFHRVFLPTGARSFACCYCSFALWCSVARLGLRLRLVTRVQLFGAFTFCACIVLPCFTWMQCRRRLGQHPTPRLQGSGLLPIPTISSVSHAHAAGLAGQ